MSWSLSAYGHAITEEVERKLVSTIGQVLADAGHGTVSASFGGQTFSGDPRYAPVPPEVAAAEDAEPGPTDATAAEQSEAAEPGRL